MHKLKKVFRRLRTLLWTALTLLTVVAAVGVGIGKLLMPYSTHYQPELEAWLSKAFNQPVRLESFSGEWKAFGPRISLQGVTLMPEGARSEIAISQAALDIKPLNALIPGRPLYSFRIIGADLKLERTADGRYLLSGLGVSRSRSGRNDSQGLSDVALNGEVRLQDISLSYEDPEREIHLVLGSVNGRLKLDGRRMAAEIQARLIDRGGRRVVGDLDAIVKVRLDPQQHLAQAQWHVKTGELMLAELVRQLPHHSLLPVAGRLNAELWGEWQLGSPQQMQGVVDLRDALLASQSGPLVIDHLNSLFNFQFRQRRDWRIDLSDLTIEYRGSEWRSQRFSVARSLPQNLGIWVSADYLELDYPLQLTQRIMATYDTPWPAAMPQRAQGSVTDFDLLMDAGWRLNKLSGRLEGGRFWNWQKGPNIAGLDASIDIDAGAGEVRFGGGAVTLDWLRVFRRPVTFAMSDCRLEVLWTRNRDWRFDLNRCHAENEDLDLFGRVRMASSEGKPVVDINVAMARGNVARFGDYWPENIMGERSLRWLRTSLLGGRLTNGRYSMSGDLDDFPFKNGRGRLQASASLDDVSIKYAEDWPDVREVGATIRFEGPGMYAEGRVGDTAGAPVERMSVRIADLKRPVLDLTWQTSTALPKVAGFIKQSPLLEALSLDPGQFVFGGPAETSGQLHARLGQSAEPLQVEGSLSFKGNRFTDLASGTVLDGITGTLDYGRDGLSAKGLDSTYKGLPVTLDITSDWDAAEVFRAHLHGVLPVDKVVPASLLQREPLFGRASGSGEWDIDLWVAGEPGAADRETWLELASGLEGVQIDLPAPLDKPGQAAWPLRIRYPVRAASHVLTADLQDRMQLQMELSKEDARPLRAALQFGHGVAALPGEGLFVVDGSTGMFDLDGWIDLVMERFSKQAGAGGLALRSAAVKARQLMVFNRRFDDVGLAMTYEGGVIAGVFDGRDIDGSVRYHTNEAGAHSMSGEFERLIIPDPVDDGMRMESDPSQLPEMHFFSKQFSYLGMDLGETRIEGYPVRNGFHIESLEARSPSLIFSARGDWLRDAEGERSDFNIRLTSESLGAVLQAMDVSSAMQGGQTVVHFDAWWRGPPAAFAMERLNGEIDLSIVQGNILTADPGAGRMLGLLSLTELPRRLAMDFRDVFDDGFSFDEAKGSMQLENGTSFTDDLVLRSTAAQIAITGSTDLVAKTFDYEFTVRPGVSKTLPMIGALAGGPAGAAAGLALQALLRNPLAEATEARYKVSGPWSDPTVELVAVVPAEGAGAAPADKSPEPTPAGPGEDPQQTDDDGGALQSPTGGRQHD